MRAPDAKICGLTRREDAELAAAGGARFGGVILAPGGKRSITAERAAELFHELPLLRVGVFVDAPVEEVVRAARVASLDVVQLHGEETPEQLQALRDAGPWILWKAVRPRQGRDLADAAQRFAGVADGLLLDGWSAAAPGGTGSRFPWVEVAPFRRSLPAHLALIVAGGLDAGNVGRAVALLDPAVVDVSSGVESAPGIKDPHALPAFLDAVRRTASSRIDGTHV